MALADGPDIDVVVELIGGSERRGAALVQTALRSGKHVVTANKALLAMHGAELATLAEKKGAHPRLRGGGRGRHPDHQGAARGPGRQPRAARSTASSTAPATTS